MTIINCTPHRINVVRKDGSVFDIDPSGTVPRCATSVTEVMELDGISIVKSVFGEVTGLPEEQPGTFLVVARLVLQAAPHRLDLLAPGELVRDEAGQPKGCRGLSR
jgi:hypothetical protein